MMALGRRGFIGALAGLLVSPAIVRASSLMPISTVPLGLGYQPNGLFSLAEIAKEMARLLSVKMKQELSYETREIKQAFLARGMSDLLHVDSEVSTRHRTCTLADYSQSFLEPQAEALAALMRQRGTRPLAEPLDLPRVQDGSRFIFTCVEGATVSRHGVGVQGLIDYNIATDSLLMRLAIRHG